MVKGKNNEVTLNDLASMVAKGFDNTSTKQDISDVNARISNLEKKVDKIDFRVDEVFDILKRFEENDIFSLQKRVQILEKAVRSLASQPQK